MKKIFLMFFVFILGCPKKETKTIEELEREQRLKILMQSEDEFFDELPESDDSDEEDLDRN